GTAASRLPPSASLLDEAGRDGEIPVPPAETTAPPAIAGRGSRSLPAWPRLPAAAGTGPPGGSAPAVSDFRTRRPTASGPWPPARHGLGSRRRRERTLEARGDEHNRERAAPDPGRPGLARGPDRRRSAAAPRQRRLAELARPVQPRA